MADPVERAALRLRVVFAPGAWLGPGKADLMEGIRETGSIAAAGRRMGMSYKRAWTLVEALNALFAGPLVDATRGGAQGGGARLTAEGERVLALYRGLEGRLREAGEREIAELEALRAAAEPRAEDTVPGD